MTDDDDSLSAAVGARLRAVLSEAVAGLDPADRAERLAWCAEHDVHGVRMQLTGADDLLEFVWGGRRLALVHRDVLLEDGPVSSGFVAALPDTLPDGWAGQ